MRLWRNWEVVFFLRLLFPDHDWELQNNLYMSIATYTMEPTRQIALPLGQN